MTEQFAQGNCAASADLWIFSSKSWPFLRRLLYDWKIEDDVTRMTFHMAQKSTVLESSEIEIGSNNDEGGPGCAAADQKEVSNEMWLFGFAVLQLAYNQCDIGVKVSLFNILFK